MKKRLLVLIILLITCSFISFAQVQLKFVTITQYGNNLYLDNVSAGNQFDLDVAASSINNIYADTNYTRSSTPFSIAPIVSMINIGRQNITSSFPFTVTMTASPGGYTSTKTVSALNSGQSINVVFDDLTITPDQGLNITITTNLTGDENPDNNTLNQYSVYYFSDAPKTVLLEEWTSSTCAPCASNNPTIDAFVAARFDSLVPIKYHMNWPAPGNDPMYLYNPTQANDRRNYYKVNSVPHVIMDGVVEPTYPYSTPTSLPAAFYPRKTVATPLTVAVTDTRIANGDSIKADITVQVLAPISNSYYLRVHAVERHIHYNTAPGTNGEKDFYDVFRKAYPTSLGTLVPQTVGTYNFTITYAIDKVVWVDSMIYTAAFVQNDATKEVVNSGKGRNEVLERLIVDNQNSILERPAISPDFVEGSNPQSVVVNIDEITSVFNYEFFEDNFPPNGWAIKNPNNDITFEQFTGANGPSFGGNKSVKMDFYSYSTTGRSDTLISKVFSGLSVTDSVKFDYAYAQYQTENDRLIVKLSTDGGLTFPHTIFDKAGSALATAPATTNEFVPTNSQWETFTYSLESVLPVELKSFTAQVCGNNVNLNWYTATEINNLGFEIQKKVAGEFVAIGFVNGMGTITEIQNYSFTDNSLENGSYFYRLKQVDFNGSFEYSDEVNIDVTGPQYFSLNQNYPNPFNPTTRIEFSLASDSKVTLKVFNLLGEEVVTLLNGNLISGKHFVDFKASNLNSGIYLYKLNAVGISGSVYTDVKKMTLIK